MRLTREQCIKWGAMCHARAAELRAAGDIKHAEGFEEGAHGYNLALARMNRHGEAMRGKSRIVEGVHGRVGTSEQQPRNLLWDAVLEVIGDGALPRNEIAVKLFFATSKLRSTSTMIGILTRMERHGLIEKFEGGYRRRHEQREKQ